MHQRPQNNPEHNATPLSLLGLILAEHYIKSGKMQELTTLIDGHTFGSAVTEARKKKRLSPSALVRSDPSLEPLGDLEWNEIEQDRSDPRRLDDEALRAVERLLDIPFDELQRLASDHDRAADERDRMWNMLTREAHAFRRRREA